MEAAVGRPGCAAWLHASGADLCLLPLPLPQFPFLGWLFNTSMLIYLGGESSNTYQQYMQFWSKTRAQELCFPFPVAQRNQQTLLHTDLFCGILVATLLYWLDLKGI